MNEQEKMPYRRQPKTLESLSLRQVCEHLHQMCRQLQTFSQNMSSEWAFSFAKQILRPYYVNAIPASLRSRIIEETSKMLYTPTSGGSFLNSGPAPLYLLTVLLGHDIKQLRVNLCCYYGCSHQTLLLDLLASEGKGIQTLELARSALLTLEPNHFNSALLNMKNLLSLTLRNIASDQILEIIGKACTKLEILDVACSKQVTDEGLRQLLTEKELRDNEMDTSPESTNWTKLKALVSKLKSRPCTRSTAKKKKNLRLSSLQYHESRNPICKTLKVLNIANTSVTHAGVMKALLMLSKLESLAEYNHMGGVVEMMNVLNDDVLLSLTQARSCKTSDAHLELLAQLCPRIEMLHIFEPLHPPEMLKLFPCVTSLRIHGIPVDNIWLNNFYEYLRTNGSQLQELHLHVIRKIAILTIDLKHIFNNCSNLRQLMTDGSNIIWSEGPDPSPLRDLQKVRLGHEVYALALTKILSLAPQLTTLHIHRCPDLNSSHFKQFFTKPLRFGKNYKLTDKIENSLVQNLSCFFIYETNNISEKTVLDIINNWRSLKKIGNLSTWGLSFSGITVLKGSLEDANLDLELCNGSHWFWSSCIHSNLNTM
ncbi:PREDICTED: uncharacterized protein LOC107063791 [Polistes dominula]|uniref:Uncharacterized protein LOC107063791 n=1 Tax=Polistes dominula TaxID=743375 RepID=A0ABM1HTT1_POLDO|nr:PREDICTED: uncharacterized protein LOC107063791 [Polistes dominula]